MLALQFKNTWLARCSVSRHLSVQGQLARNLNRGLYQKTAPYRYQVLSMKEGREKVGRVKSHNAVEKTTWLRLFSHCERPFMLNSCSQLVSFACLLISIIRYNTFFVTSVNRCHSQNVHRTNNKRCHIVFVPALLLLVWRLFQTLLRLNLGTSPDTSQASVWLYFCWD